MFLLTKRARRQQRRWNVRCQSACVTLLALALMLFPGQAARAGADVGPGSSRLGACAGSVPTGPHCSGNPTLLFCCRAHDCVRGHPTQSTPASTADSSPTPEPPGWMPTCAPPHGSRDPSAHVAVPAQLTQRAVSRILLRDRGPPA